MMDRPITRSMSSELQARPHHHHTISAQASGPPWHNVAHHHNSYTKGVSDLLHEAETSLCVRDPQHVLRNTTEEMFIKSIVEGSAPAPNMEGMGFANIPHAIRADSEELFNSWMCHGEGQSSGQIQAYHRPRQSSCRMSSELAGLLTQPSNQGFNRADSFDQFLQANVFFSDDVAGDNREGDTGATTSRPPPLKPMSWFSQHHPMTRSRSSELRRRYAAMQGRPPPAENMHEVRRASAPGEISSMGSANRRANQPPLFPQANNHASLPSYHAPVNGPGESVSSFVSLLKGTLERKKLEKGMHSQHQEVLDPCVPQRPFEELQRRVEGSQYQGMGYTQQREGSPYHVSSPLQLGGMGHMQQEGYGQAQNAGHVHSDEPLQPENLNTTNNNTTHPGLLSHAPSPSESSAGAPVLSTGEDPCNSGHTNSLKRSARNSVDTDQQLPARQNSISNHNALGTGETVIDGTQKGDLAKQKSQLTRVGSVTSSGGSGLPLEKEDPTKKRRVERQRKMAEAKGRASVPMLPSDLQAALKRCDTLEKEVRSLKLNLAFMNRKDSDQTKQIEELQKQNEILQEEKKRLLEDIEQLTAGAYLA